MKNLLNLLFIALLISCGSTQTATNQLQTGNYEQAFNTSVTQLNKGKTKKSNQKHIPLLKEAYTKAAEADLSEIKGLQGQNTAAGLKKIYSNYLNLDIRQDEVRALQPLYFEGQEVTFSFEDYSDEIKASKNGYSEFLYKKATQKLKGDQLEAREAHKNLEDLIYINPSYKNDLNGLLQQAKNKGSSFVFVTLKNNIKTISKDSIVDFTSINSANFANQWVIYHDKRERNRKYDYRVDVIFNKLIFEPEKTQQQTVPQEAKVQDGWQYKLDDKGNVMKDDKGNDIKTPKYKVIKAEVALYQQNKASKLEGTITINDLKKKTTLANSPEFGEARFQHTYGKYRGDQRAIEQKYHAALKSQELPYPKDYEFIKYTVSNFKQKVTAMLGQQQF